MLVVDARDSGRALFIDMEVLDLDRRMSWAMVRGPGGGEFCATFIYHQNNAT